MMMPSGVCPAAEDALRALLGHLVDPLLMIPAGASQQGSPSLHEQQSVAKQVHSAVILYNYYHRKRCQDLGFLDFASFCKLAVDLRPALLAYMEFTRRSDRAELTDPQSQLSLTESAIMDACDICTRLDSSSETQVTEGWPVSKVTVLLVDSRKENCWLLFGSVAEGVWSMIEKNVDEASLNPESTNKRKRIGEGPVKDDLGIEEDALRRLAFLAVKEAAGIDMGDLLVSESHVVYPLSKEKSVSRFYIMQSNIAPKAKVTPIPVKDVIDRLQGPLITRSTSSWCVAPAVEYFPVLPYAGIISDWLSREVSLESSQNLKANIGPTESDDLAVLASRDKCLTQVARSVILGKRKNLLLQLRRIKDGLAQCSSNLRILREGGDEALALKLDCLVDASSAPRTGIAHDNCCLAMHTTEELLSEVTRTEKNPPAEGKFVANQGTDKSVPDCATKLAAVDLLGTVRNLD